MLEEPASGRDLLDVGAGSEALVGFVEEGFVFVGDVFESSSGDPLGFFAESAGYEICRWCGRVEMESPADFVGHPVADAGEVVLVEDEGFEVGAGTFC